MTGLLTTDPQQRSATVALAVVLVVAVVAVLVDAVAGDPTPAASTTTEVPLVAGATTCAAGAADDGQQLVAVTAADPDAAQASGGTSWATLVAAAEGRTTALPAPSLDATVAATPVTAVTGPVALHARWEDAPLLLSRRWTVGEGDRVPGTVEGPCPAGAATRWHVPGVVTAGGAAAALHLANPDDVAASVQVRFSTPDGLVEPTRLANLVVPAHGRTTIDLNAFAPEEPDLGIEVIARAGTFVAEAEQTLEAAVGGVDGRSLVVAHPEPATVWTLPYVPGGDDTTPWVWVTNPSDEPADVGLVVHTPEGPVVPPAGGATLAPHTTERIDLRGALAGLDAAGVTVRSTDVPVVVGGAALRTAAEDAVRGGIAVLEATVAGDGRLAALTAVGAAGRTLRLGVTNPADAPATVTVRAIGAGADLVLADQLVLPAGASTVLTPEGLPADVPFAVVVEVSEGVAAATLLSTATEGPLDLTAALARPFPSTVVTRSIDVRRDDQLLHPVVPDPVGPVPAAEAPQP